MLRAIIFDFDGIIVDSEPLIMRVFQQMATREGWALSEEEYYRDYLALDDRGIVDLLYTSHGRPLDRAERDELVEWKFKVYAELIKDGLPSLPGAVEFVTQVSARYPLAIASGSLRSEIEHLLRTLGLFDKFTLMVTADDVERSKPSPEVFLKTLARLSQLPRFDPQNGEPLRSSQCLVIEDAPAGVEAAHAAGLRCLALTHSRPPEELAHADWVARGFQDLDFEAVRSSFD